MNTIKELHQHAMELADKAVFERINGNVEASIDYYKQACEYEKQAANSISKDAQNEPTRSILFRSAASLAIKANDKAVAENLVFNGLAGFPPDDIKAELLELFDQIDFERHLDAKGIVLNSNDCLITFDGNAIGPGTTPGTILIKKLQSFQKLLSRTVERKLGHPFREFGTLPKIIQDYDLYITASRSGSFKLALRVSNPKARPLPGFGIEFIEPDLIVEEIMDCLDVYNRGDSKELLNRITDEAYYRNFVSIAKNLSPDGEDVTSVIFEANKNNNKKLVVLKTPRTQIKFPMLKTADSDKIESIEVTGYLNSANKIRDNYIIIVDSNEKELGKFEVPKGIMDDIVKPLWGSFVNVIGHKIGANKYLDEIKEVPENY
ncbi:MULTISPECIES: hypothetical protein [Dehalococcoides]|uniref:hypothetical protein n=1 Tax=Dehalococcoides TaxID=61434 RepID=UPI0005B56832|nr:MULTISPECIES: hypothetical protein [Dehalococcoides]QYY58583.1 hypothetical protein CWV2_000514 [Dehalococcoides mccartyi]BAQ34032.1 hypothetical protein UCH007_00740 [Dehalococcoides sp. UCH007]